MQEIEISDEDIQQWGKKKSETNGKVNDEEEEKHSKVHESPTKSPESVANGKFESRTILSTHGMALDLAQ